MYFWTIVIVGAYAACAPQDSAPPAASQPTTQRSSLRKPVEAELLGRLLRDKQATTPILPVMPRNRIGGQANGNRAAAARGKGRLPEGVMLVERTGRLVRDGENSYFEFDALGPNRALKRMRILPNELLEQMEHKMTQGAKTFKISAETTLYRGENYLMLRKEDAIMSGGNLSP
jgi:hypothetical protein